jgi:uncharacterized protein (DUF1501 family)
MVRKTLIREAYSAKYLPRDPYKVDEIYRTIQAREYEYAKIAADAEIKELANTVDINPDTGEVDAPIVIDVASAAAKSTPDF